MRAIFHRLIRRNSAAFLLGAVLFACAPIAVGQEGSGKDRETRQVQGINNKIFEQFAGAQSLMEVDDYQGAKKILDRIKAKPKLSSPEAIQLWSFYGVLYFSQEKYKESIQAFETMLGLPDLGDRQRTDTLYTVAQLRFTIEDWQGALDIMNDWVKVVENPPPGPFILLASAYYQLDRFNEMIQPIERAMAIARQRDKPVKEQWWLLLRVAYYELNNIPEVVRILEILVVNWPKKQYWTMLSGMYGELDQESKQLAAYEAAYDQDLLNNGRERLALVQLLLQGEAAYKAAKVLQQGLDSGLIETTVSNYRLLSQAWQVAAEYEKAIPPLKKAAEISEDGELDVRLASSYLNLGRYAECATSARAGLRRSGLERPATAHELLGMCLFELDEYDEAIKSFRTAARDKKIEKRARNWIKYITTEQARLNQINASIRQAESIRQARIDRRAAES